MLNESRDLVLTVLIGFAISVIDNGFYKRKLAILFLIVKTFQKFIIKKINKLSPNTLALEQCGENSSSNCPTIADVSISQR